jgi:hypothetical protein
MPITNVIALYLQVFGNNSRIKIVYVNKEKPARFPYVKMRKNASVDEQDPHNAYYNDKVDVVYIYYSTHPVEETDIRLPHLDLIKKLEKHVQNLELNEFSPRFFGVILLKIEL